ncbi:paeninodin family lasso peptide [Sporolactobacillus sp. Y61]|uniref:Paeninodin family lasso peptide n=1 Tax=Sporolactobacillus sp. Y61 TaxID=3160863 RepID=A0AAU8IIR5_9BACL
MNQKLEWKKPEVKVLNVSQTMAAPGPAERDAVESGNHGRGGFDS